MLETHLKDIYNKNIIDSTVEPTYESLRIKFLSSFSQEPSFFIRVPYTQVLLGDNITQLFNEKVVANISRDFIIAFAESKSTKVSIDIFDKYTTRLEFDLNEDYTDYTDDMNSRMKAAYISALKFSNLEKKKGANVLVLLNTADDTDNDVIVSSFIASFLCCLVINTKFDSFTRKMLFDMCYEQLSKLGHYVYYDAYVYTKLCSEKNSIVVHRNNKFEHIHLGEDFNILLFDSLTAAPMISYSANNFWNKRKVEVKLAILMILKRSRTDISEEEIKEKSRTFVSFLKHFENNFDVIYEMIEIYLKKTPYSTKEIKSEIGFDLKPILKEIDNSDIILVTGRDFNLNKRILFLLHELQKVLAHSSSRDLIQTIKESHIDMKENYDCISDQMTGVISSVNKFGFNVSVRVASQGWAGNLLILGQKADVEKIGQSLVSYIDGIINSQENTTSCYWLGEEADKYCSWSEIGGNCAILNPKLEDFMLSFVKNKI